MKKRTRAELLNHIQSEPAILSLVVGKWTSFRAFSEQVTDRVLSCLNLTRKKSTKNLPIGGGREYPLKARQKSMFISNVSNRHSMPLELVTILFDRYGTRCREIAQHMAEPTSDRTDVIITSDKTDGHPYFVGVLDFWVRNEMVCRVEDSN